MRYGRSSRVWVGAILAACGLTAILAAQQPPTGAGRAASGTVLITGSNRGLGLEFVKQYAARGWKVIATTRDPGAATDVRDRGVIVALVSPPPTETDMLKTLIGPEGAARQAKAPDAIGGLIKVIDGLTMEHSGGPPIYFDGALLPW